MGIPIGAGSFLTYPQQVKTELHPLVHQKDTIYLQTPIQHQCILLYNGVFSHQTQGDHAVFVWYTSVVMDHHANGIKYIITSPKLFDDTLCTGEAKH